MPDTDTRLKHLALSEDTVVAPYSPVTIDESLPLPADSTVGASGLNAADARCGRTLDGQDSELEEVQSRVRGDADVFVKGSGEDRT